MRWDEIVKSAKWMILNNDMNIENVSWVGVGKYLAVIMTPEEILEEGLEHVVHKRKGVILRKITVNYLCHKKNYNNWQVAGKPEVRQKKKILVRSPNNFVMSHLQIFKSDENQLFYVLRDKKKIRAYVNTPATAKLAIAEKQKCDHSFRFSKGSQKTLKFILIR